MYILFRNDSFFKLGWLYFILMFILEAILPEWVGNENGIIENLQMLWLIGGMFYCIKTHSYKYLTGAEAPRLFGKQAQFTFSYLLCMK